MRVLDRVGTRIEDADGAEGVDGRGHGNRLAADGDVRGHAVDLGRDELVGRDLVGRELAADEHPDRGLSRGLAGDDLRPDAHGDDVRVGKQALRPVLLDLRDPGVSLLGRRVGHAASSTSGERGQELVVAVGGGVGQ